MADKVIGLPTDDELFTAFSAGIEQGTPESRRHIIKLFDPFIEKAKAHIKNLVTLGATGLEINFTAETGDKLLEGLVSSQGFLLKMPLRLVLSGFGADSFTNFVEATKEGKNNHEVTVGGLTTILTVFAQKLGERYAVVDTAEAVKAKVEAVFA